MGIIRVERTVKFSYTINDPHFSGSEMAQQELTHPFDGCIDAYLEPDDSDRFEVLSQTVIVELETHLSDADVGDLGETTTLDCGHYDYSERRCVVAGCSNYVGLAVHGPVVVVDSTKGGRG